MWTLKKFINTEGGVFLLDWKKWMKIWKEIWSITLIGTTNWSSAGVNFINILWAPFSFKSVLRKFSEFTIWVVISWQKKISAKAAGKMLVKLTAGVNFINILWAPFCTKVLCADFTYLQFSFVFWAKGNWQKAAYKMLVKLITACVWIFLRKRSWNN